jgi:hypothetical protein
MQVHYALNPPYLLLVCDLQSKDIRWAMAGRNRAKLEEVKQQLTKIDPACAVRVQSTAFQGWYLLLRVCGLLEEVA